MVMAVMVMMMFRTPKFVSKMHFFQFCLPVVLMVVQNGESLRERLWRGNLHDWFVVTVRRTTRMMLMVTT